MIIKGTKNNNSPNLLKGNKILSKESIVITSDKAIELDANKEKIDNKPKSFTSHSRVYSASMSTS